MLHSELTARELEAFRLIAEGKRDKDAAQIMGVGAHHVRYLIGRACLRLGAETRTQACLILERQGKLNRF